MFNVYQVTVSNVTISFNLRRMGPSAIVRTNLKSPPLPASPPPPLVLPNLFTGNLATSKGGAIELLSGSDRDSKPGAGVVLRNSTFLASRSEVGRGGVLYLGEFANATVQGDGNVFEGNTCGSNGGVFAVAAGALVTVEGGSFTSNSGTVRRTTRTANPRPSPSKPLRVSVLRSVRVSLSHITGCLVLQEGCYGHIPWAQIAL